MSDRLLRTLIEKEQVSLVGVDSTETVRHAQIVHNMTAPAARAFGRALTVMTYMSCWLKEDGGELSLSVKHHGETGEICVSGDAHLRMRGYVHNPFAEDDALGKGYMTVVRDDNYGKPFVGTCELVDADMDKAFEYYYRLSEQLPTYMRTDVVFDEHGLCKAAGGVFLQPMPGAEDISVQAAKNYAEQLSDFGKILENKGMDALLKVYFGVENAAATPFAYGCRCSREYISGVLRSLGEKELRDILQAEGKIDVHCHYCNSDYVFYGSDVDKMFPPEDAADAADGGAAEKADKTE